MVDLIASRPQARTEVRAIVYVAALGAAAVYFLIFPVWRGQFLVEIWPTESWNAYWQDAAANGAQLYPDPSALVGNNYPPLSFYAVALVGKLFGLDNLLAGRALSIAAVFAIGFEIAAIVRLLTPTALYGTLGALWYIAIMARNSTIYVGANDPQLAGLAIMGAGLLWLLERTGKGKSPTPALLLMVVAGFWKHNNIAIPLTSIAWLFLTRNPFALRGALISSAAAVGGLALCTKVYGPNFLPNLLADRSYGLGTLLANVGHLQWVALALMIWAAWAWNARRSSAARFTSLHVSFGLFACLLQWTGHGVSGNAEFDLILALAIGIGIALAGAADTPLGHRLGAGPLRDLMIAALLARLLISDRQEGALVLLSEDFRASLKTAEANLLRQSKQVADIPGDVACTTKLVCRTAGKPFVVDEFKVEELILTGRATDKGIAAKMVDGGIRSFEETRPAVAHPGTSISAWFKDRAN